MKMEFYSKIDRSENKTSVNLPAFSFSEIPGIAWKRKKSQIVVSLEGNSK